MPPSHLIVPPPQNTVPGNVSSLVVEYPVERLNRISAVGTIPVGVTGRVGTVVGRIYRLTDAVPPVPPVSSDPLLVRGDVAPNGRVYWFQDCGLSDDRIPGAMIGADNVLVTWVQFVNDGLLGPWIRCLEPVPFFGVDLEATPQPMEPPTVAAARLDKPVVAANTLEIDIPVDGNVYTVDSMGRLPTCLGAKTGGSGLLVTAIGAIYDPTRPTPVDPPGGAVNTVCIQDVFCFCNGMPDKRLTVFNKNGENRVAVWGIFSNDPGRRIAASNNGVKFTAKTA